MKRQWNRAALHLFLLFLLLAIAGWLSMSRLAFWSPDSGLRYLVAVELIESGWRSIAIDYGARFLDPQLDHVPYYYIYFLVGEEMLLRIPTLFPLVASLLMPVIGRLGLVLLPVLGGVACAAATYKLGELGGIKRTRALLWLSVLGTPVLFYSLEFWDHTFITALSLWAVYFLAKAIITGSWQLAVLAGALAGVSFAERAEFAAFAAALGLALLLVSRIRLGFLLAYGGGVLLTFLPLALLQYVWTGHPLGVTYATYGFGYGVPTQYPFAPSPEVAEVKHATFDASRMLTYVEAGYPISFMATILCLVGLTAIVFALRTPRWRKRSVLLSGAGLSYAGYLLWLFVASDTAVTGIIPTLAILPFSVALVDRIEGTREHRVYHLAGVTTIAFVGMILLLWPYGGQHWGTRYMLPAYLLLLYMGFYAYEHYREHVPSLARSLSYTFVTLLILSILMQFAGVRLLLQKHARGMATRERLQALPADVIVTNSPFLPSEMVSLDKSFLYISEDEAFQTLVPRMWEHDVHLFAVAPLAAIPITVPQSVGEISVQEIQPNVYELRAGQGTADASER